MTSFVLNGKAVQTDADPATPLLWVLRESMGLTGTKYGCGMAQCGACTVHLDGQAIRSCVAPLSRAEGKHVTTIEGLSPDLSHPLQRAWIEIDVPQCGNCQWGKSWAPRYFFIISSRRRHTILTKPCPATSAGAELIRGFGARFTAQLQ